MYVRAQCVTGVFVICIGLFIGSVLIMQLVFKNMVYSRHESGLYR